MEQLLGSAVAISALHFRLAVIRWFLVALVAVIIIAWRIVSFVMEPLAAVLDVRRLQQARHERPEAPPPVPPPNTSTV